MRAAGAQLATARWLVAALLLGLLTAWSLAATPTDRYPALTGRVVDAAGILDAARVSGIETKLKALEAKSGIQLVVATVPSLGGDEIEPYANGLFRFWKLGEAKANNGALLLVAPKEKRVRIEVGYGLEGTLTDALSKIIITNAIVPRFKTGDFGGGIERGVDDIVTVLSTDSSDWQKRPELRQQDEGSTLGEFLPLIVLIIVVVVFLYLHRQTGRRAGGGGIVFLPTGGSGWGGGGSFGGGGDGGGFSGGGGSSGGGGASGGW